MNFWTDDFFFRTSVDGFIAEVGTPVASGATINLSSALFQNVTAPIEFRLYGYGLPWPAAHSASIIFRSMAQ
jgi:hypothetical protein